MAEPTPPGITLTRPGAVKETAQTLLGGLFADVVRLGGAAAGFGQVTERTRDLAKRFTPDDSPAEAGWRLVYAALVQAITDAAAPLRHQTTIRDMPPIEHLMQLGGEAIDFDRIEAPANFLQQPKGLPLLRQMAPVLQGALVHLGMDEARAAERAAALPGLFVAALAATWNRHEAGLGALEKLTRSPFEVAARQERHWAYYRAMLERELLEPLFAGAFSLRDLYQPLRGYWRERVEKQRGEARHIHHVVDLATTFDGWLDSFDARDALRVVTGGPGSGKSSFVKWWAASVLGRQAPVPTLLLPLHKLDTFDLEAEAGKQAKLLGFPKNPLDADGGERRLLLILDGLDELDADHKTGREAASALITRVDRLLERNRYGHELQVVIAGRELIVSALRGELDREHQVFHVMGYLPRKPGEDWRDPARLLAHDQRKAWWRRWGELTGEALDDTPDAIARNQQLAELSEQPLLNHLLAVTRAADPDALGRQNSINGVYRSMLEHVWRRSWGDERQLPRLGRLTQEDFQKLFESIGLAVWQHGGGRSTTLETVAEIARRERLGEQLDVLTKGAESGALDLLTAFYFRREAAGDTFELTHKSFGEYFAALRLLRLAETLHRSAQDPEFEAEDGLRRWYRWTHAARITEEILAFVEGELRGLGVDEISARRGTLIQLFDRNLRTGMAHLTIDGVAAPAHFRQAQQRDAAAELALFTVLGACTAVLVEETESLSDVERRAIIGWSPAWPDREQLLRTSAWDLLRRLEVGTALDPIVRRHMLGMDLTQQIVRADLAGACWIFASAKSANLIEADLSGANVSHANLSQANLSGANLSGANLSHAKLSYANLSDANLFDANLCGTDLCDANLSDADLSGANLTHANLSHANLIDADLFGANLSDANLSRASLGRANLSDANLSGAHGLTPKELAAARSIEGATLPDDLPEE
jgi:hypothetical protein